MKKKNLGILCAALALCGTAIFGTYALLTAKTEEPIVNSFSTTTDGTTLAIELTEPAFTDEVKAAAKDYVSNQPFAKDPQIKNISAKQSMYVAIKVTYKLDQNDTGMKAVDQKTFNTIAKLDKINTGWTLIGTGTDGSELYLFDTTIAPEASTGALFNEVKINDLGNDQSIPFDIVVEGFGTQSEFTDVKAAQAKLLEMANVSALK